LFQIFNFLNFKVPNDFIAESCKCLRLKITSNTIESFSYKKCDLNAKSIEQFFISLGLPMYIELLPTNIQSTKHFCDTTNNEVLQKYGINNKSHVEIILNAIEDLKKII
jgi:hypothetical protein